MPSSLSSPAYRIHTERLVIRCWDPADGPLLSCAIEESLAHLRVWMPWAYQEPRTSEQRLEWLRQARGKFDLGESYMMGIWNREETQVLGGTGLHLGIGKDAFEIGYWIHAQHVNQGLATESSAALTQIAFEVMGAQRVEIHCDPANLSSAAVPKKLGFMHEATLRQRFEDQNGHLRDSMIWSLFAEDYSTSKSAAAQIEAFDIIGRKL